MKSFLVDFENVKSKGLVGIDKLTEDDHVVIFYSENSDTISFDMHCCVMRAKASVEYMKVRVGGKNALDFQLSTLLGYMVAQKTNTHIFIISNDKGFDKLHDFWENTFEDGPECVVFRTQNITAAINFAKHNRPASPAQDELPEADENADTEQEQRSVSAEIVVAEESASAESAEQTVEENPAEELKLIVPEPLVEKFREDLNGKPEQTEEIKFDEPEENSAESARKGRSRIVPAEFIQPAVIDNDESVLFDVNQVILNPKAIAPGEKNVGLEHYRALEEESFNIAIESILSSPEKYDKTIYVRDYMTGIDDAETIEKVTEAICASTGKLDFHNRLMKLFGAETSSAYYNMIKPYYEIAKRIFAEIDKRTSDNAEAQPDVSPCENTEPEKADSTAAAQEQISEPAPKKVDAAMKKRLHQILDEPATFDEFSGIVAQINQSATLQQLYINMIQRFKKDRGRELYGLIKTEYKKFISEQEKTEEASAAAEDEVQTKKADGAMKKKLHALLDDKTSADEFAATVDIVNRSAGTHELYLGMIKRFGKKRGLVIYNEIKKEFTAFVSPAKKA